MSIPFVQILCYVNILFCFLHQDRTILHHCMWRCRNAAYFRKALPCNRRLHEKPSKPSRMLGSARRSCGADMLTLAKNSKTNAQATQALRCRCSFLFLVHKHKARDVAVIYCSPNNACTKGFLFVSYICIPGRRTLG